MRETLLCFPLTVSPKTIASTATEKVEKGENEKTKSRRKALEPAAAAATKWTQLNARKKRKQTATNLRVLRCVQLIRTGGGLGGHTNFSAFSVAHTISNNKHMFFVFSSFSPSAHFISALTCIHNSCTA